MAINPLLLNPASASCEFIIFKFQNIIRFVKNTVSVGNLSVIKIHNDVNITDITTYPSHNIFIIVIINLDLNYLYY